MKQSFALCVVDVNFAGWKWHFEMREWRKVWVSEASFPKVLAFSFQKGGIFHFEDRLAPKELIVSIAVIMFT